MTRAIFNGLLFAIIGGLTAALSWPDGTLINWKFWAGAILGSAVAVKAYIAKSGEKSDGPTPVTVENGADKPVPTQDQP